MSFNIYLTFDGNCHEAFDFYKSVFGGDFVVRQTFGDGPSDMGVTGADKDRIMHVSLPVGSSMLMGSDTTTNSTAQLIVGTNFSVSTVGESKEQCNELVGKLIEHGEAKMPLQETFWGSYFGMCRDQFDINWMINFDLGVDHS